MEKEVLHCDPQGLIQPVLYADLPSVDMNPFGDWRGRHPEAEVVAEFKGCTYREAKERAAEMFGVGAVVWRV